MVVITVGHIIIIIIEGLSLLQSIPPYKAIKFAFDAKLIDFNPDINLFSMQTFSEVCSISFNEDNIKDFIKTIYEKRYISFVGICPAPSQGYTICKYTNWVGMHGKIGDKNNYRKHE